MVEKNRRFRSVLAIGIVFAMIFVAFSMVAYERAKANDSQTSTIAYPNSDWLSIWQGPNQSDPLDVNAFPITSGSYPAQAASFWGSNTYLLFDPDSNYTALFGGNPNPHYAYTWADVNNRALFPDSSHLIIGCTNSTAAAKISNQALTDSRIIAIWFGDFIPGNDAFSSITNMYNASRSGKVLPFYLDIYSYVWNDATHFDYWTNLNGKWPSAYLPYFDGVFYGPWTREGGKEQFHSVSIYDSMIDLHRMLPGKKIFFQLFNWHYTEGAFQWDYMINTISVAAQLYRSGIVSGISMLATFFDDINNITSNYMRNLLNTEVGNDYQTTVNLNSGSISTEINGLSTIPAITTPIQTKANNWTIYSFHTQTITFTGYLGNNLTVRDLKTGTIFECADSRFSTMMGENYQVYNWPHTTQWINGNYAITTPTKTTDKRLIVNGSIYVNSSWNITRSLVQIGIDHYIDLLDNHTASAPTWGIWANDGGNEEIIIRNSTIEPLNRLFPYGFSAASFTLGTRSWEISNSTIACFADNFRPMANTIRVMNSVFFNPMYMTGTAQIVIGEAGSAVFNIWKNNLFYSPNRGGSVGVLIDMNNYVGYAPAYEIFENNTIVGSATGINIGQDYANGTARIENNLIYRSDYNVTADDHYPLLYPNGLSRDITKSFKYSRVIWHTPNNGVTTITTKFRIDSTDSFSGILKDSLGNTIGTYSSINDVINAYQIPIVVDTHGVITSPHPYPWTFQITSELSSDYYWGVSTYGGFGLNSSKMFAPNLLPITSKTVTFNAEDSVYLHLIAFSKTEFVSTLLDTHPDGTIDFGNSLYPWSNVEYESPVFVVIPPAREPPTSFIVPLILLVLAIVAFVAILSYAMSEEKNLASLIAFILAIVFIGILFPIVLIIVW